MVQNKHEVESLAAPVFVAGVVEGVGARGHVPNDRAARLSGAVLLPEAVSYFDGEVAWVKVRAAHIARHFTAQAHQFDVEELVFDAGWWHGYASAFHQFGQPSLTETISLPADSGQLMSATDAIKAGYYPDGLKYEVSDESQFVHPLLQRDALSALALQAAGIMTEVRFETDRPNTAFVVSTYDLLDAIYEATESDGLSSDDLRQVGSGALAVENIYDAGRFINPFMRDVQAANIAER